MHSLRFLPLVVVALLVGVAADEKPTAEEAGFRLTGTSSPRGWRVVLAPEDGEVRIGPYQAWTLDVLAQDGTPVATEIRFEVSGGMDAHGHGLPSRPQVAATERAGRYRLEGLRFTMAGRWQLRLDLRTAAGTDRVAFDFEVRP